MARPTKNVPVVVTGDNIKLSVGHLHKGDEAEIPRDEAEGIVAEDEKAGRKPRIKIKEVKREAVRDVH